MTTVADSRSVQVPAVAEAPRVRPGSPAPLGATWSAAGTNFAVFSAVATSVVLCLFDDEGTETQVPLTQVDSFVWHALLPDVRPGQRYGFRVEGPWSIDGGDRCNPKKLLLDPYALAITGDVAWGSGDGEPLFDRSFADNTKSQLDSAPFMPRSVVVDRGSYHWSEAQRPNRSVSETVVYECHVKGMTALHPDVPTHLRGTYSGLVQPAVVRHLQAIGVTAVELMPVHQFVSEQELVQAGRSDYWGYNTLGFFAPHNAYSSAGDLGQQVDEFKAMVEALHNGGLEVILDVVYNHTAEGGTLGPSFSFRGLDHRSYYLLGDDGTTIDDTGCGNTLNIWDPAALRLVMDSLRYWVTDMHVDGFRFDLASALASTDASHSVSVFLDLIAQDPVLTSVKLIAEPWNEGRDGSGYLLGRFPPAWSEWNDTFRGAVRDTWRSIPDLTSAFRDTFEGTPSVFDAADGDAPSASVNYAASHDGLTVRDLVSYDDDGQRAWDSQSAGDSAATVLARRNTRVRAMLMTVLLAQGVPMILHGDELGRTQLGNANAYDQDNAVSWVDWDNADRDLIAFVGRLTAIRHGHPVFRQPRFRTTDGTPHGSRIGLQWYSPSGDILSGDEQGDVVTVVAYLDGSALSATDATGRPVTDTSFLFLVNAWWEPLDITIPSVPLAGGQPPTSTNASAWLPILDSTSADGLPDTPVAVTAGAAVTVAPRSALLLQRDGSG